MKALIVVEQTRPGAYTIPSWAIAQAVAKRATEKKA